MGVPTTIVSDGGPQYTSAEFKDFMKDWQIEHKVSLPRNPQSNGMAERCVENMKASLLKTIEGEDVNLALLTSKTTPLSHSLPSPAELLNSRKYKTLLPTHIVPTRLQEIYKQIMDKGKQVQAVQQEHQGATKTDTVSESGHSIRPAVILQCSRPAGRSYSLWTIHGGVYTGNRRFIKLDLTAAEAPVLKPICEPNATGPTRTIQ